MYEQSYEAPSLERYGSIEALTAFNGECVDIIPGNDKGLGGPVDLDWRVLCIACDLPDGGDFGSGL